MWSVISCSPPCHYHRVTCFSISTWILQRHDVHGSGIRTQLEENKEPHTLMALRPSVTSLAVALAGPSVAAAVSVPAVAGFGAVCPPVAGIAGCSRNMEAALLKRSLLRQKCGSFAQLHLLCKASRLAHFELKGNKIIRILRWAHRAGRFWLVCVTASSVKLEVFRLPHLSCSCVPSSLKGRSSVQSPRHSVRCSHRCTS